MTATLALLLQTFLLGLLAVRACLRGLPRADAWALAAGVAAPVGVGLGALLLVAWRALGGDVWLPALVPEWAVIGALAVVLHRERRPPGEGVPGWRWGAWMVGAALVAAIVGVAVAAAVREAPFGQWDAWANWNMKGRLFALSPDWLAFQDPELPHPVYPPLLPAAVGRVLGILPGSGPLGPSALAVLFGASAVLAPAVALGVARGPSAALLGALIAAAGPNLIPVAATQYADVPVAALFACGLGLLLVALAREDAGAALAGGLALGLAAWTKREGLVMAGASLLAFGVALWRGGLEGARRRMAAGAAIGAGALLLPLLLLGSRAPASDYGADGFGALLARLADADRIALVARSFADWFDPRVNLSPLLLGGVCLLLAVRTRGRWARFPLAAVAACLVVDAAAYVATRWSLEWQLQTSLTRVLLQLWPAAVVGAVGVVGGGRAAEAGADGAATVEGADVSGPSPVGSTP